MHNVSHANSRNNAIPATPHDNTEQIQQTSMPTYIDTIFQQLEAQDVEQFYKSYQFWQLQRRIGIIYTEIEAVQQAIDDNATLMEQISPSAIALASLAQLQASGVSDISLLDRMLERGDAWLDRTMQLLEHCEKMDLIGGDYTQWCEHALEGAYSWIASMEAIDSSNTPEDIIDKTVDEVTVSDEQQPALQMTTEEQLLQKLMSDEDATDKMPVLHSSNQAGPEEIETPPPIKKITQPLAQQILEPSSPTRKITQPLELNEQVAGPESRKTTRPLDLQHAPVETELPIELPSPATDQQIDKMKDIVAAPDNEDEESITQEMVDRNNGLGAASKDADTTTGEKEHAMLVDEKETSGQAMTASMKMVASQQGNKNLQHQQGWHALLRFLFVKLLALFYRKR